MKISMNTFPLGNHSL